MEKTEPFGVRDLLEAHSAASDWARKKAKPRVQIKVALGAAILPRLGYAVALVLCYVSDEGDCRDLTLCMHGHTGKRLWGTPGVDEKLRILQSRTRRDQLGETNSA